MSERIDETVFVPLMVEAVAVMTGDAGVAVDKLFVGDLVDEAAI